jgi:CheY-like chemotaxis protein
MDDGVPKPGVERSHFRDSAHVTAELPSDIDTLKRAIRARDRAAAVVAHDLRNPIGVVSVSAGVLLQMLEDPQARRHVQRIAESVARATSLIDDLLDVAAIEEGKLSVEKHWVDLSKVMLDVVGTQQTIAADRSIIASIDLSPDLPRLEADERRIHEVLENLIGNAVKFTGPGGSITVGAKMQAGKALVWVKDTGSGIAKDDLPHLFDRFWQAGKSDRRGTGLGLTICKAIVEGHGGRIWVESALGCGTTVFFTLPVPPSRAVPATAAAPANVLLVDDKPENLIALEAILDRSGYRLLTARSGEEALRIALRERLSVALIDVVMPGMDGLEVTAHLKALDRCRDVPILFITASGNDPQEIRRAYDAGCADYLMKPLDPEIVRKKVAVFVNLGRR